MIISKVKKKKHASHVFMFRLYTMYVHMCIYISKFVHPENKDLNKLNKGK